jgi:hypothetical protein
LFLAGGCGLSEYEKRMDQQDLALKRFDEESKALGEPLDSPMLIDVKTSAARPILVVEFFLRPPKGTHSKAKDAEEAKSGQAPLVCYPGPPGFNVLVSTQGIGQQVKEKKEGKDKKKDTPGTMTTKEFQHQVRAALARFYDKEFKKRIDWSRADKTDKRTVVSQPLKGAPVNLIFDNQTLTDDPDPAGKNVSTKAPAAKDQYHDFRLFFYQTGAEQAAVIYQIPAAKRNDPEVNKGVDFSLRTLALGFDSLIKRQEFQKRKR